MSKRSRRAQTGGRPTSSKSPTAPGPAPAPIGPTSRRPPSVRTARRTAARSQRSLLPLVLGGVAVVAAAVLAVFLAQGGGTSPVASAAPGGSGGPSSAATASLVGAALPAYASDGDDPAVGQPIPEVNGSSFDGSPVSVARDGRPKVLLFLAHWCPHCRQEVPKIQDWIDANGMPEDVDFVSIATGIDPRRENYPPDAWLVGEGWTPPVLVDADNRVAEAFGLTAYPYWVAVKGDGTVAARATGAIESARLDALVGELAATAESPSGAPGGSPRASPSAAAP